MYLASSPLECLSPFSSIWISHIEVATSTRCAIVGGIVFGLAVGLGITNYSSYNALKKEVVHLNLWAPSHRFESFVQLSRWAGIVGRKHCRSIKLASWDTPRQEAKLTMEKKAWLSQAQSCGNQLVNQPGKAASPSRPLRLHAQHK